MKLYFITKKQNKKFEQINSKRSYILIVWAAVARDLAGG